MDCWKIQGYKSVNAEPASTFVRPPLVTFAVLRPTSAPSQQCSLVQTLMVPNPTQKVAGVMVKRALLRQDYIVFSMLLEIITNLH